MDIMGAIALAAKLAELAIKVGTDAMPFIAMIKKWSETDEQPTAADFAELNRQEQVFLNLLNDRSRDDGA